MKKNNYIVKNYFALSYKHILIKTFILLNNLYREMMEAGVNVLESAIIALDVKKNRSDISNSSKHIVELAVGQASEELIEKQVCILVTLKI